MILNPNVNVDTEKYGSSADWFYPDDGYALWIDDEEGNLDENGEPMCYWLNAIIPKTMSEERAPHIWAKLIDDTMEVFGDTDPNEPEVATFSMRGRSVEPEEDSHTYIDENGVERQKKGVY